MPRSSSSFSIAVTTLPSRPTSAVPAFELRLAVVVEGDDLDVIAPGRAARTRRAARRS